MKILSSKGHISNFKAGDELVRTKPVRNKINGHYDSSYIKEGRIKLTKINKEYFYYTRPDLISEHQFEFKNDMNSDWAYDWKKHINEDITSNKT